MYPREKAYLQFDNTSYYVGDTIWFKAYVTVAQTNAPSTISKPLYVELVDQMGHIADRQIIKLTQGQGHGQLILPGTLLSGYYEIRAYTRWMLAFEEPQYFSRVFPIYKAIQGNNTMNRSISTYQLSSSMKQREQVNNEKELMLRFFPEGGQLIQGIDSKVAFKAENKQGEDIELKGTLNTKEGEKICDFSTLHNGMGYFNYTPTSQPAVARVIYKGIKYEFTLPQALLQGFALQVSQKAGALAIKVSSNVSTVQDSLAVFISYQGYPYHYQIVNPMPGTGQEFKVPIRQLPSGVLQISLINKDGNTICDRFVFSLSHAPLQISCGSTISVYTPYAPIRCEFSVSDSKGMPIQGTVAVSVRNAIISDDTSNEDNILTRLLLTSDLKGYIHQPAYYFTNITLRKQQELDVLLLVHGWRKYDMSRQIAHRSTNINQFPESNLNLYGEVRSAIIKKKLGNIELSAMIKKDHNILTGSTVTDEDGRFSIPLEDFEGTAETILQTRRLGKKRNKDASILIDRNFSPTARPYNYHETHPEQVDKKSWQALVQCYDSLYMDSIRQAERIYFLNEVEITGKSKKNSISTYINEQSIDAYYDIRREVDLLRDQGKIISTIPELMERLSPQFYWDHSTDEYTYRQKPICYIMDNKILSSTETAMMLTEVDGLASIIIGRGTGGISDEIINNSYHNEVTDTTGVDISQLDKYCIFYLIPIPGRDVMNKNQTAVQGTRQTIIQGYTHALEYYSPAYPINELYKYREDTRRTLYWNPSLQTNANGKVTIECYNNQYTSPLIIQAEAMNREGEVGTLTYSTLQPLQ